MTAQRGGALRRFRTVSGGGSNRSFARGSNFRAREPEALSIPVQPRRDPLVLIENLIELFDVLERRFNAVIFEVQTGRRYGKKHFRGPLN